LTESGLASLVQEHRRRASAVKTFYVYAVDARNAWMGILGHQNDRVLVDGEQPETFLPRLVLENVTRALCATPNILPVFVLDGDTPRIKAEANAERKAKKDRVLEVVKHAITSARDATDPRVRDRLLQGARRRSPAATRLNRKAQDAIVKELLDHGFPVYQAPGEAEAQAAHWARTGRVRAVATRDFDAFLFGAPRVGFHWPRSAGYHRLSDILSLAGATCLDDLVCAYVLAGATGYAPAAPGIWGVEQALRLIGAWGFEGVLARLEAEEQERYREARKAYRNPVVDEARIPFQWGFLP
jgi:flap endonuclease-1